MEQKPVINVGDVELTTQAHGDRFEARVGSLAAAIGAEQLGCRVVELPPGKRGWPRHNHHANEELFFVLEGSGTYIIGEDRHWIGPGDLLAAPAGGADTAHQIVNTSHAPLRYLALSTMREPDVIEYPDSDKLGVLAGAAPGGDRAARRIALFVPRNARVDYWHGEN